MAKDLTVEIEKIDAKIDKINGKKFPPIIYETYIEYKLTKLGEKRASLRTEMEKQCQSLE